VPGYTVLVIQPRLFPSSDPKLSNVTYLRSESVIENFVAVASAAARAFGELLCVRFLHPSKTTC